MAADPFEIYAPKGRVLVLGLLGVLMTALSALPVLLVWSGRSDLDEMLVMLPIGVIGLVFFGFATLTALYRLFSPRPIMRVDAHGIHVWRYPSLSWQEFSYAETVISSGEVMLVLNTHDDDAYRARMIWYRRLWARANAALVEGAVYLSQRLLPVSASDLAHRINEIAD